MTDWLDALGYTCIRCNKKVSKHSANRVNLELSDKGAKYLISGRFVCDNCINALFKKHGIKMRY